MVTLTRGLQWGECILALVGLGVGGAVELGFRQASNGEQLGLLVEGKGLLAVQVDGQSRDAKD